MKLSQTIFTRGIWIVWPWLHVRGLTLFPFVFIKERALLKRPDIVRHERIHLCQQLEMLVLPFYLVYLWQYFRGRSKGLGHDQAYRAIVFEREAYDHDDTSGYLKNRKNRAWKRYLK